MASVASVPCRICTKAFGAHRVVAPCDAESLAHLTVSGRTAVVLTRNPDATDPLPYSATRLGTDGRWTDSAAFANAADARRMFSDYAVAALRPMTTDSEALGARASDRFNSECDRVGHDMHVAAGGDDPVRICSRCEWTV